MRKEICSKNHPGKSHSIVEPGPSAKVAVHFKQSANSMKNPRILIVVTSAAKMPNGESTGLWLEEFAVPYEIFKGAGAAVTVASPRGGAAPIDPRS